MTRLLMMIVSGLTAFPRSPSWQWSWYKPQSTARRRSPPSECWRPPPSRPAQKPCPPARHKSQCPAPAQRRSTPTTMPTNVDAITQLHHGLPPQLRSISVWPIKPIRPPATGPYIAASRPSTAYCRLMFVFGMPLGIATKRPSTKNSAAPMATATTVLTEFLLFMMISSSVFCFQPGKPGKCR